MKKQTEPITITQPAAWIKAFERAAETSKQTLSEWIGARCIESLPLSERAKLPCRRRAGRPPKKLSKKTT